MKHIYHIVHNCLKIIRELTIARVLKAIKLREDIICEVEKEQLAKPLLNKSINILG